MADRATSLDQARPTTPDRGKNRKLSCQSQASRCWCGGIGRRAAFKTAQKSFIYQAVDLRDKLEKSELSVLCEAYSIFRCCTSFWTRSHIGANRQSNVATLGATKFVSVVIGARQLSRYPT